MRSQFGEQMAELNRQLIAMGALCEEAIALAAEAVTNSGEERRSRVRELAEELDQREREVEMRCFKLLLRQQPVAGDLRQISAALKMVTDLERIGNQAGDIAEITVYLEGYRGSETQMLRAMAEETIHMVTDSVDAFVRRDMALARAVVAYDDVVDNHLIKMKSSLIQMIAQDKNTGEYALDFLMIAKYFERIGDHAANLAEWVIFSVTGTRGEVQI